MVAEFQLCYKFPPQAIIKLEFFTNSSQEPLILPTSDDWRIKIFPTPQEISIRFCRLKILPVCFPA
jgi:hypothetical protein